MLTSVWYHCGILRLTSFIDLLKGLHPTQCAGTEPVTRACSAPSRRRRSTARRWSGRGSSAARGRGSALARRCWAAPTWPAWPTWAAYSRSRALRTRSRATASASCSACSLRCRRARESAALQGCPAGQLMGPFHRWRRKCNATPALWAWEHLLHAVLCVAVLLALCTVMQSFLVR